MPGHRRQGHPFPARQIPRQPLHSKLSEWTFPLHQGKHIFEVKITAATTRGSPSYADLDVAQQVKTICQLYHLNDPIRWVLCP